MNVDVDLYEIVLTFDNYLFDNRKHCFRLLKTIKVYVKNRLKLLPFRCATDMLLIGYFVDIHSHVLNVHVMFPCKPLVFGLDILWVRDQRKL